MRELVRTDDAREHGEKTAGDPPADGIAKEIDLLAGVVLGPETDSSEKEWPLNRLTGVRMAARESIVVEEDGTLQLKVFHQEGESLHFLFFLNKARTIFGD